MKSTKSKKKKKKEPKSGGTIDSLRKLRELQHEAKWEWIDAQMKRRKKEKK